MILPIAVHRPKIPGAPIADGQRLARKTVELFEHYWPRANDGQVTLNDVDELGKFIEMNSAQDMAKGRHSRVRSGGHPDPFSRYTELS